MIYLPYKRTDLRKRNKKLRIAVIPGINEKNFEFSTTKGSGYRVDYSRTNQKAIKNEITKSVEKVLKTGCDIIVFPEYITSLQFFLLFSVRLRNPMGKMSGKDDGADFSRSGWTKDDNNVLKILDAYGDEIGSYYKYSAYIKKKCGKYEYEQHEDISDAGKCCDLAVRKETSRIGNAGIVHKNDTVAGIHFEDICREDCSNSCETCICAYIIECDFTYDDSRNTKNTINRL